MKPDEEPTHICDCDKDEQHPIKQGNFVHCGNCKGYIGELRAINSS